MKIFVSILFFVCLFCPFHAFSEEIEIDSEVFSVEPGQNFFIIKAGEALGVEIGDGLIVHRDGERIAAAYIVEIGPELSAVEIIDIEKGKMIQEGDSILIVKKVGLEPRYDTGSAYTEAEEDISLYQDFEGQYPGILAEQDLLIMDIERDPKRVFTYCGVVLRENGFSIIASNRAAGVLQATKPIDLSLIGELWADAFAEIDHKLSVSFEIRGEGDFSRLTISSFQEHSQKDKFVKRAVTEFSTHYNELLELASQIKERSEY
ncbi:MAG: hypothetical protein KJ957_02110 [Candidatus Omnitrophica bacterium]|nr:hypothetical protein [Candidatus Omnitrophota bacterium]